MLRTLLFNDLRTNCFDLKEKEIKLAMLIHPKFFISGLLWTSKAPFASILAALIFNCCSYISVFEPLHPHTEQ